LLFLIHIEHFFCKLNKKNESKQKIETKKRKKNQN